MEYAEFLEYVRFHIQQRIGVSRRVFISHVLKNNRREMDCLTILGEEENAAPSVCMEPFYEQHRNGRTPDAICEEIAGQYAYGDVGWRMDLSFYTDYEKARDHIVCRLVNYERNKHMLACVPHRRFLDLAVVYYCRIEHPQIGRGNILVQNAHLALWDVELEELEDAAMTNTVRLCPYELTSIDDMLERMLGVRPERQKPLPMYVLSNTEKCYGAVCIIFDAILEAVAEKLQDDFYILPSSIHECVLLPALEHLNADELQQMVHDINAEHVADEEVLGESVYRYNRREKSLTIEREG